MAPRIAPATRLALVLVLAAAAGFSQETDIAPAETFFERIAVDIVNVEVYVTDAKGEPVSGLGRDDFEVLEDGRPVEVVNFYPVSAGRAVAPEAPAPDALPELAIARPPVPEPWPLEPAPPESQRLHLIVYVDNYNIHPLNRNRVFARLRLFLADTLEPGDQVMVASYDRSLHVRQPFTGSAAVVNRTLIELEKLSGNAVERESERDDAVRQIYEATSLHEALFHAKNFSEAGFFEVNNALDALDEMLASLAGLPGRKMLLHLSDGLPMVPGQDLYQAVQQRYSDLSAMGEAFSRDLSRRFMEVIARANSNRVSFYTVDASGLNIHSGIGAENRAVGSKHVVSTAVSGTRNRNLQSTLLLMAERTGGQAIINTNDVTDGLARFARDFDNYYSLGYRAPGIHPGRYHSIEVRLRNGRKGLELRHREGYRDKPVEAQLADAVTAFVVHGYESNPLGVAIELGEQTPAADGNVDVAIRVGIPLHRLVLIPRPGFHEGQLRIYFGAVDQEGRDAPLAEVPLELRIPDSSVALAMRDEVVRIVRATMRPGPHKLVIVVRDELSEERSVVGRLVTVRPG